MGGNITAGDFGGLRGCGTRGLELGGLLRGVRGLAALRAVLVVLPLLGGKTALLLGTCSVPLAVCWVLGGSFPQSCTVRQCVTSTHTFWKIIVYPKICFTALKVHTNCKQKA